MFPSSPEDGAWMPIPGAERNEDMPVNWGIAALGAEPKTCGVAALSQASTMGWGAEMSIAGLALDVDLTGAGRGCCVLGACLGACLALPVPLLLTWPPGAE